MTVYAIAQISITDRDSYKRYLAGFMEVFGRSEGRLPAADASVRVVEGVWDREKVVLMSFPDERSFEDWAQSPAYQAISTDRRSGADGVVPLVRGLA